MPFIHDRLMFVSHLETDEQEAARLAKSPVGSKNHTLSSLPVTLPEPPRDLLVQLPREAWSGHNVIVHVDEDRPVTRVADQTTLRQRNGAYVCSVVASDHPSYPVGGHRIIVPETEMRRGTKIVLDPATGQRITD